MGKLTAAKIKNLTSTGKYSDGGGLMFVVGKSSKSWFYKARLVVNGEKKNIDKKIGSYPNMPLSEARVLAADIKSSFQNGINYFDEQSKATEQAHKEKTTFKQIADNWIKTKRAKSVRESTISTDLKRINKHIHPTLADTPIKDIDKPLLRAVCDKPALTHPHTANRVAAMLESVFEHAVMSDAIDTSPAQYLTKFYPKPKTVNNPYLVDDEITNFLNKLDAALSFELFDAVTYHMILIQFHTLSRPSEIATLKWEYIDFSNAQWTIPVMEGVKLKAKHTQPLSPQVISLLEAQQAYSEGSEYVFPTAKRNTQTPHRSTETANKAITLRMKYKGRLTSHGLRHTAATALGKLGYDRELVDLALSHEVGNTVSRTYNKDTRYDERKEMLEFWSNHLTELLR